MRCKVLLLALTVVVACGAGPFRGGFIGRSAAPAPAPVSVAPQTVVAQPRQTEVAQILFKGADGMNINWDTVVIGGFDSEPLVSPGLQNFATARSYRLKLSNIPNRPNLTLYPTLTINAVTPRTKAYLDHNAIPVKFTDADFDQIQSGNFVTKVIFLPSPQFQNLALVGGVDTIVNTQLPAGTDPIAEAQNRGAILAVVQIGNKDLSLQGSSFNPSTLSAIPSRQIPISGVNAPAFGTPAAEAANAAPTELPTATVPKQPKMLIEPASPNPSTGIPAVEDNWNGNNFN